MFRILIRGGSVSLKKRQFKNILGSGGLRILYFIIKKISLSAIFLVIKARIDSFAILIFLSAVIFLMK